MKGNELVWRTIVDFALDDRRMWNNVDDLAHRSGVPASSAVFALKRLTAIGAVERRSRGGFYAVNHEKILLVLAAWRNLENDVLARTSADLDIATLHRWCETVVVGGGEAAVQHLDARGVNTVADLPTRIVYVSTPTSPWELPPGEGLLVLPVDRAAQRDWWSGITSRAQTYADLFALPGWQAEEFRRALHRRLFVGADWDQKSESWQ